MSTAVVRCHYDDLRQVSQAFQQQSQSAQQLLQNLRSTIAVLQGGDWVGQGASAFYQEMDSQVLPTLQRLAGALEAAAQNTSQISQTMQGAEDAAARVLRGSANGAGTLFAATGGLASPGRGGGSGGGLSSPVPGPGRAPDPKSSVDNAAKQRAAENAAVDHILSQFDPKVRAIVKQSPTLRAQLKTLDDNKFPLKLMKRPSNVEATTGSQTYFHPPTIEIYNDANLKPEQMVLRLTHESGIAHEDPKFLLPQNAKSHKEYMDTNMPKALRSEAKAIFNEVAVRQEILAAHGPDIGLSDTDPKNRDDYLKPFNDFQNSKRTPQDMDKALASIQRDYDANMGLQKVYTEALEQDFNQCQQTHGKDCGRW
jgi:WXG100 family type VII secretion target